MDHKPRKLWEQGSDQLHTSLRQPKTNPLSNYNTAALQGSHSNSSQNNSLKDTANKSDVQHSETERLKDIVAKSTLRVDASEWFPSKSVSQDVNINKQVNTTSSSVQNRLKVHKIKPETNIVRNDGNSNYTSDLNRLKQIIATLIKDPGQFHNLFIIFMETLEPYLEDIIALSHIAEIIVDQAINHPNFRYTGARLCGYIEPSSPGFRAELHLKCKKQIEENPDTKNVLPLIAELYTQLPHLSVYGTLLISAFKKLIELGGNDNVKCICQALKLTGYTLEQSNKADLDKLFKDLRSLKGKVDGSASFLLESVFQLKSNNWGHSSEEVIEQEPENDVAFDSVEFFDLDGEKLTNEESEFLATHMTANDDFDSEDFDPDELYDPEPEMDEEIQAGFKEFLKLSVWIKAVMKFSGQNMTL